MIYFWTDAVDVCTYVSVNINETMYVWATLDELVCVWVKADKRIDFEVRFGWICLRMCNIGFTYLRTSNIWFSVLLMSIIIIWRFGIWTLDGLTYSWAKLDEVFYSANELDDVHLRGSNDIRSIHVLESTLRRKNTCNSWVMIDDIMNK